MEAARRVRRADIKTAIRVGTVTMQRITQGRYEVWDSTLRVKRARDDTDGGRDDGRSQRARGAMEERGERSERKRRAEREHDEGRRRRRGRKGDGEG